MTIRMYTLTALLRLLFLLCLLLRSFEIAGLLCFHDAFKHELDHTGTDREIAEFDPVVLNGKNRFFIGTRRNGEGVDHVRR